MPTYIFFIFFFLIIILQILTFMMHFKRASKEKALVVYGKMDPKNEVDFLVHTKGGVFVWPFIQKSYYFWMDTYEFASTFDMIMAGHNEKKLAYNIRTTPSQAPDRLKKCVDTFFGKTKEEIESEVVSRIKILAQNAFQAGAFDGLMNKEVISSLKLEIEQMLLTYGFEKPEFINLNLKR